MMTHADRIAALEVEAAAAENAADLAEARGLRVSAKFQRSEAARIRAQIERVRGEMLTVAARQLDAEERRCCREMLALVETCIGRASRTQDTAPAVLYELQRILLSTQQR